MNETLGSLMDRLKENTILDLHFTHDDVSRYAVPEPLATHPNVGALRSNSYLRSLPVGQRDRYSNASIRNGYDIFIPAKFDRQAWAESITK